MPRIFISYRRDDSANFTGRIHDHLERAFGHDSIFKDVDKIELASDFRKAIEKELHKTDILVAVIGPHWLGSVDSKVGVAWIRTTTTFVTKLVRR